MLEDFVNEYSYVVKHKDNSYMLVVSIGVFGVEKKFLLLRSPTIKQRYKYIKYVMSELN